MTEFQQQAMEAHQRGELSALDLQRLFEASEADQQEDGEGS